MNDQVRNPLPKKYRNFIIIVSIAVPIVVALLSRIKVQDFGIEIAPLTFLPPIYAFVNGLTAVLLILGVITIKNNKRKLHKQFMTSALLCSVIFLLMYVAYHFTTASTVFGDSNADGILDEIEKRNVGLTRYVYLFILSTHIILSMIIIPMVLLTYFRGLEGHIRRHKKIARITFPLWLYVAITGVLVYLLISPYYVA